MGKRGTQSRAASEAMKERLPVLFVHIGWARRYDGTEEIVGNFSYLQEHPKDNSEAHAFHRGQDGYYRCGIGRGAIDHSAHVVLLARDPKNNRLKIVGLYPQSHFEMEDDWAIALCRNAIAISPAHRPLLRQWLRGQSMRRWAWRAGGDGTEHPKLLRVFMKLARRVRDGRLPMPSGTGEAVDEELEAFEGKARKYFVTHREREANLRLAKIREALQRNRGRLICEVPGCAFDFGERYGDIGRGYAQVHHLRPLGLAAARGTRNTLLDLAIVCANCHAMIHRGGECRDLETLLVQAS